VPEAKRRRRKRRSARGMSRRKSRAGDAACLGFSI